MKLLFKMIVFSALIFSMHSSMRAGIFSSTFNDLSNSYAGIVINLGIVAIGKGIYHILKHNLATKDSEQKKHPFMPPVSHKVPKFNSTSDELIYHFAPNKAHVIASIIMWASIARLRHITEPNIPITPQQTIKHFMLTPLIAGAALSLGNFGLQRLLLKIRNDYCSKGSDVDNKMAFLGYIGKKLSHCSLAHLTLWLSLYKNKLVDPKGLIS